MAVPVQTPYIEYTANGSTTSFSLGFYCELKEHLIVTIDDVEPLLTDWSLSGGNVVFAVAPLSGKVVKIQRNTPFSRSTDYQSYDNSFRAPSVNKDFDSVWYKLQELGVTDWILSNRIDALKNYVNQQDGILQDNIDSLKNYVDDKDDELRNYLLNAIQEQGVALGQLEEYYSYLMQQLAQVAIDRGWAASFIVSADGSTQQEINDFGGAKWWNKPLGYDVGSTVKLENGDIVKSTVPNNITNPNVDMSGWVNESELTKNVTNFGAKSNKSSLENFDSTQAFKDALDYDWVTYPAATSLAYYPLAKNKRVRVPLGRYLITDTLPLTSYLHLDFDDGVVIDFKPVSKIPLFAPPIQKMKDVYAAGATTWKDMTIHGLQMTGAALLRGNMTANSTVHATYAIQAANTHRANFSRIAIEGFEIGLAIERLDTSSWTGGSTIGNFYENVVDNVSIQDCKLPFFNSGNLTTMIGGRIGHEVLQTTDANMGDYLVQNYGAGFTSLNLNIASVWRGSNPKKGHIYEACAGSTYHGLYSEYFDNLFVVDPLPRFGGLTIDVGHVVKYPADNILKFIDGYLPHYNPATDTRGGVNLKSAANWVELFTCGIRIMNSNAELLEDFFEFAPQYDFKYGMYGTSWYWTQNIAVDFKRWENKSTGFLSSNGARFIATQASTIYIPVKNSQYDANVCVLLRDLLGTYSAGNIKLNVYGSNEFISVAESVYDYGNGWKMYSVRNAQLDPKVKFNLQIDIPAGCQIEIEHIGAYKGGIPLFPTFKDYAPKVNSDNYMYSAWNDIAGGAYQYKYSGGQFGLGDVLAPFIPILTDGSIVTDAAPIANQYVQIEGSNRQTVKDGNHTAYYGAATITFTDANTFDSAVTASGNSRDFAESVGVGQYVGVTQGGITTADTKVVGRVYDVSTSKYTTKLVVDKSFNVDTAVISHADAQKPIFSQVGFLSRTQTYDPPSLAANAIKSTTVTVAGALVGNTVGVSFSQVLGASSRMWGEVTATNTVTVYHQNLTAAALDIASGVLTVKVQQ